MAFVLIVMGICAIALIYYLTKPLPLPVHFHVNAAQLHHAALMFGNNGVNGINIVPTLRKPAPTKSKRV